MHMSYGAPLDPAKPFHGYYDHHIYITLEIRACDVCRYAYAHNEWSTWTWSFLDWTRRVRTEKCLSLRRPLFLPFKNLYEEQSNITPKDSSRK